MLDFLDWLFDDASFMRRRLCGPGWSELLVWVTIFADATIFFVYVLIPTYIYKVLRILRLELRCKFLLFCFCAFIFSCGITHLTNSLMFYFPMYRLDTSVKVVCAIVSALTLFAFPPVIETLKVLQRIREPEV